MNSDLIFVLKKPGIEKSSIPGTFKMMAVFVKFIVKIQRLILT